MDAATEKLYIARLALPLPFIVGMIAPVPIAIVVAMVVAAWGGLFLFRKDDNSGWGCLGLLALSVYGGFLLMLVVGRFRYG